MLGRCNASNLPCGSIRAISLSLRSRPVWRALTFSWAISKSAVDWAARVLLEHPGQMSALWFHAAALAFLGRTSEANAAGRTIVDVLPMARISSLDNWMTVARTDNPRPAPNGLRLASLLE
jgi:hypothetical protein